MKDKQTQTLAAVINPPATIFLLSLCLQVKSICQTHQLSFHLRLVLMTTKQKTQWETLTMKNHLAFHNVCFQLCIFLLLGEALGEGNPTNTKMQRSEENKKEVHPTLSESKLSQETFEPQLELRLKISPEFFCFENVLVENVFA